MNLVNKARAKEILLEGNVVAIPTETVYGLAGWIFSEAGLKNIFSTKERPFFDPLIVHVNSIEKARALCSEWTQAHEILAQECWPGPLTLIAKKNALVHPLITSGLDSVGLRCPNHPETLALLQEMDGGLAAPSANKFGKTSPTTSAHVAQEFSNEVPILDGGPCEIGIESTVVGIKKTGDEFIIEIFRPGFYTASKITDILKNHGLKASVSYTESPVAPGQLKHHYMPKIPLVLVSENSSWDAISPKIESKLQKKFLKPVFWKLSLDPNMASRELYEQLRTFDEQGFDIIITSKLPHHFSEDWMGIWNRLQKAKTLDLDTSE